MSVSRLGMKEKALPPGPANLVVDALSSSTRTRNENDDGGEEEDEEERVVVDRNGISRTNSTVSSLGSLDESSDGTKPRTTTTVTTVTRDRIQQQDTVNTTTYTHLNATSINPTISKSDGSLTLRPIHPRGTKVKTRRNHFIPRTSAFDRNNQDSAKDPFRGFFTLFWIIIAVGALRVGIKHYSEHGTLFRWTFAKFISQDGWNLALSDAVMLASTCLCVPFAFALKNRWIRYNGLGQIIQHIAQTAFLAISVRWTFHKSWPWVQSGFLVLHTLTMLMKVHSYCAYNGELSEKTRQLEIKRKELNRLIEHKGGETKCQKEAREIWEKEMKDAGSAIDTSSDLVQGASTTAIEGRGDVKASDYAPTGLKQRLEAADPNNRTTRKRTTSTAERRTSSFTGGVKNVPLEGFEALTWHPDETLSKLAVEVADLDEALVSTGVKKVRWPANISFFNFIDYLLVPTLVYHLEYPRTNNIRPMYVIEKVGATFGTFMILLLIVEHVIIPAYPKDNDPFYISLLDLAIPFMVNYLLIFYIIFECILNGFAELTFFADRGFYSDWWNSQSFDEFSRKWNVPVHTFLLRHVYTSTISAYRFSKFQAAFATFLLSACVHELVMVVAMKKVRLYLFLMQMCQLPLIMAGRLPFLRKYPALGNLFFWIGLLSGFPLLAVCYIRY